MKLLHVRTALAGILLTIGFMLTAHAETLVFSFAFDKSAVTYDAFSEGQWIPRIPDGTLPNDNPGAPWLPVRYVNIRLPEGTRAVSLECRADRILLRDDLQIAPEQAQHPVSLPATPALTPPNDRYAANERYPSQDALLLDNQFLRGFPFVSVRLHPLTCNPAGRELFLATNLEITIEVEQSAALHDAAPAPADASSPLFETLLNDLVINPYPSAAATRTDAAAPDEYPSAACDYLIITTETLSNSFRRLADFRAAQNSLNTRVVTLEYIEANYSGAKPAGGTDTQTKIRNCISNYVHQLGTAYVVLGGDNTILPDRDTSVTCGSYSETAMPTDLYYSGLDGTWDANANGVYGETADAVDMAYDVIVGRIPVRTAAQADAYINKLKAFETNTPSLEFMRKTILLGDMLWNTYTNDTRPSDTCADGLLQFNEHNPVADDEIWTRRLYRERLSLWTNQQMSAFFDSITSWDSATSGDYSQNAANVRARFNEGWNHAFFATHGGSTIWGLESGSFGTSDAAALTNLQAIIYTMACLTGGYDLADPSLSEAFIRNASGGALAYMGCSRYGWGSPGSYYGGTSITYADHFYNQVFTKLRNYTGIAFAEHKLAMASSSTYNGANRWVQFGMNLQGDPLVPIRRSSVIPGDDPFWFTATALTNNVILRWPNPVRCGMNTEQVRIDCNTSDYPSAPSPTPIYTGTNQQFVHTGLAPNQTVFYTIWVTHDGTTWTNPPAN